MEPRRNDPCPCGSGEKYKRCCETRGRSMLTPAVVVLAVLVIGGLVATLTLLLNSPDGTTDLQRVWSEEHGHWHTVGGNTGAAPAGGAPVPQPGPAPPGKVWSEEHGHWHDAP